MAPIQIPLSVSGPAPAFAAALEEHRAALAAHRTGEAGVAVPIAHTLLDSLVLRVPATGPVATRGPDTFVIAPYEIVDDTPPPPPAPTVEQLKQGLLGVLHTSAGATVASILSPARAQLLNMDAIDALNVAEPARTPAQVQCIEAYTAFNSRVAEIQRNVANAAVEIEDLAPAAVATWKVPPL